MEKGNVKALLPIGVFLVLYLGLGRDCSNTGWASPWVSTTYPSW